MPDAGSDAVRLSARTVGRHPGAYDWKFLPEPGKTFTDSGTGACH